MYYIYTQDFTLIDFSQCLQTLTRAISRKKKIIRSECPNSILIADKSLR